MKDYVRFGPTLNVEMPFHKLGAQKCIKRGSELKASLPLTVLSHSMMSCAPRLSTCLPSWTVPLNCASNHQPFPPSSYPCQGIISQQQEKGLRQGQRTHGILVERYMVPVLYPRLERAAWESWCWGSSKHILGQCWLAQDHHRVSLSLYFFGCFMAREASTCCHLSWQLLSSRVEEPSLPLGSSTP